MSVKFGNKDYEEVPDRLKKFREANPRASIETEPTYNDDGSVVFKATIIQDQSDPYSAKATGNARYSAEELKSKNKQFEKLETVSVGRALANLGYLNNGMIATTEEMLEFEEYQMGKVRDAISQATKRDEFEAILANLTPAQKIEATPLIKARIEEVK